MFCRKALYPHKLTKLRDLYGHRGQLTPDERITSGSTIPEFLNFIRFRYNIFKYKVKLDSVSLTKEGRKTVRPTQVDVFDRFHCRKILLHTLKKLGIKRVTLLKLFDTTIKLLKKNVNEKILCDIQQAHCFYKSSFRELYELLKNHIGVEGHVSDDMDENDFMFLSVWYEK